MFMILHTHICATHSPIELAVLYVSALLFTVFHIYVYIYIVRDQFVKSKDNTDEKVRPKY